jgi:V-type H+-transporting ATPase subunit a
MQERIQVVGGVIQAAEKIRLSKLCFRATRGKAYVQFYDMRLPEEDLIVDGIKNSQ